MLRLLLLSLLLSLHLYSLEVVINSDNFNKISTQLSSEKNINALIREQRVPYSRFSTNATENFDNNSNRSATHREYAKLKMLLVSLPKETRKNQLKEKLRSAFFKQFSPKKEEFSFVYKITYPNAQSLSGDDVFEALQKKISLYILSEYGVSNIEDKAIITNKGMSSSTKNYILGTTESNFLSNKIKNANIY